MTLEELFYKDYKIVRGAWVFTQKLMVHKSDIHVLHSISQWRSTNHTATYTSQFETDPLVYTHVHVHACICKLIFWDHKWMRRWLHVYTCWWIAVLLFLFSSTWRPCSEWWPNCLAMLVRNNINIVRRKWKPHKPCFERNVGVYAASSLYA